MVLYLWKNWIPFTLGYNANSGWNNGPTTNLNALHPMMLCAKFGCYWPNGSKDENVKSLQVDRQTTGNKKKITWALAQVS